MPVPFRFPSLFGSLFYVLAFAGCGADARAQDTDGVPMPLVLTLRALWGSFQNTDNIQLPNNVVAQNATYICDRPGPVELCVDATDGACVKSCARMSHARMTSPERLLRHAGQKRSSSQTTATRSRAVRPANSSSQAWPLGTTRSIA